MTSHTFWLLRLETNAVLLSFLSSLRTPGSQPFDSVRAPIRCAARGAELLNEAGVTTTHALIGKFLMLRTPGITVKVGRPNLVMHALLRPTDARNLVLDFDTSWC